MAESHNGTTTDETSEELNTDLSVEFTKNELYIRNANGIEVVMWNKEEGKDPSAFMAATNAVNMAHEEPEKLVQKRQEHMKAQLE